MIENIFERVVNNLNMFDIIFFVILTYNTIQCFFKGFSLSFISFMKWILSTVITIILVPKLQPWVSEYIESPFINDIGLSIAIYVLALFLVILLGKVFTSSMKWTGFGPMDKTFGLFFGFFKGYVVSVCLFSIVNWFYPFNNWSIEVDKSITFNFVEEGSRILIDEFPKISSTKSLSGHPLGAASVHEAIYCLIMMKNNFIAGSANINEMDEEAKKFPIVAKTETEATLNTVMSNSFGFGGTNAALVFEKV